MGKPLIDITTIRGIIVIVMIIVCSYIFHRIVECEYYYEDYYGRND